MFLPEERYSGTKWCKCPHCHLPPLRLIQLFLHELPYLNYQGRSCFFGCVPNLFESWCQQWQLPSFMKWKQAPTTFFRYALGSLNRSWKSRCWALCSGTIYWRTDILSRDHHFWYPVTISVVLLDSRPLDTALHQALSRYLKTRKNLSRCVICRPAFRQLKGL